MESYSKQAEEISFVAVGFFNPAIFHPQWFLKHDLVSAEDLKEPYLDLNVIHQELAQFKSSWFALEVLGSRFLISTQDMSRAEELRDLAANIFGILSETPVKALGFNKTSIFKCATEEFWHSVGYAIAPREIWQRAIPNVSQKPGGCGMRSAEIEFKRWDNYPGYYRVNVYPSNIPPNQEVSIRVNDHIDFSALKEDKKDEEDVTVYQVLMDHWDIFISDADKFSSGILKEVEDGE